MSHNLKIATQNYHIQIVKVLAITTLKIFQAIRVHLNSFSTCLICKIL